MSRNVKRTLSLVLALIMLCSTMGVMAFAAEASAECHFCEICKIEVSCIKKNEDRSFNRVIECPQHNGAHDAEEYYVYYDHYCPNCKNLIGSYVFDCKNYICLW